MGARGRSRAASTVSRRRGLRRRVSQSLVLSPSSFSVRFCDRLQTPTIPLPHVARGLVSERGRTPSARSARGLRRAVWVLHAAEVFGGSSSGRTRLGKNRDQGGARRFWSTDRPGKRQSYRSWTFGSVR